MRRRLEGEPGADRHHAGVIGGSLENASQEWGHNRCQGWDETGGVSNCSNHLHEHETHGNGVDQDRRLRSPSRMGMSCRNNAVNRLNEREHLVFATPRIDPTGVDLNGPDSIQQGGHWLAAHSVDSFCRLMADSGESRRRRNSRIHWHRLVQNDESDQSCPDPDLLTSRLNLVVEQHRCMWILEPKPATEPAPTAHGLAAVNPQSGSISIPMGGDRASAKPLEGQRQLNDEACSMEQKPNGFHIMPIQAAAREN